MNKPTAKKCACHVKVAKEISKGVDFYTAYAKHGIQGYHEHRCECACRCKQDTLGYKYCPSCSFNEDCGLKRWSKAVLGAPENRGTR